MKPRRNPSDVCAGRRRWLLRSAAMAWTAGLGGAGLTGCGGGGGDGGAGATAAAPLGTADVPNMQILGVDSGGTGRSGNFFSATVAAVSPLVVAGVQFGTGASKVTDADGRLLSVAALAPGMTAEVRSGNVTSSSSGVAQAEAQTVRVAEQLIGPISAVDTAGGTITVLGQRVVLRSVTVYATLPAAAASDLAVGQVVRVWGRQDTAGARVLATRVDLPAAGTGAAVFVLRGPLTTLDRDHGRLAIGGYPLVAPAGTELPGGLALGDLVRARLPGDAPAQLMSLAPDALMLPNRIQAEIEGRIGAIDAPLVFWVDGVRIDARNATTTPAAAALVLGAQVEVRGIGNGGGLQASSVQVSSDGEDAIAELEDRITSVDAATQSFQLQGQTVTWNSDTVFIGGGPALLTRQRKVAVKGPRSADGLRVLARTIHIET